MTQSNANSFANDIEPKQIKFQLIEPHEESVDPYNPTLFISVFHLVQGRNANENTCFKGDLDRS